MKLTEPVQYNIDLLSCAGLGSGLRRGQQNEKPLPIWHDVVLSEEGGSLDDVFDGKKNGVAERKRRLSGNIARHDFPLVIPTFREPNNA